MLQDVVAARDKAIKVSGSVWRREGAGGRAPCSGQLPPPAGRKTGRSQL